MEETTTSTPVTSTTQQQSQLGLGLSAPLERSISQQSATSIRSYRSSTRTRSTTRKKLTSQPSSSASSIAPSDKSLTSFPSFSPESPSRRRTRESLSPDNDTPRPDDGEDDDRSTATSHRKASGRRRVSDSPTSTNKDKDRGLQPGPTVDTLTSTSPNTALRGALFEDTPLSTRKIPGALHHADDAHIERLLARHGAVNLVRQIAEDLAERDAQIAALRRRADERERALRKIVLECGLSNLDLETRLRAMEQESRRTSRRESGDDEGLADLMNDAMGEDVRHSNTFSDATIRASAVATLSTANVSNGTTSAKGTARGWKDYLWGGGGNTSKKGSRASSLSGEQLLQQQQRKASQVPAVVKAAPGIERRPTLPDDLFNPPETGSVRSSSRASSTHSAHAARKPSLASMALRLVAGGGTISSRDGGVGPGGEPRGRASSAQQAGGSLRTPSASSAKTTGSINNRAVSAQVGSSSGPKALMAMRRTTAAGGSVKAIEIPRAPPSERWDTMNSSPGKAAILRHQSYGPVEMDTILPPEAQPPTLTHIYNNYIGSEYLTDRFGFIYDQRRKKRQREAAQMARHVKKGSRTEMLTSGRSGLSPVVLEDGASGKWDVLSEGRPGTPCSSEEQQVGSLQENGAKPKRWQDYLKIATFPTELLSHTPLISAQAFEVMEGGEVPKSPSHSPSIVSEERGFIPSASTTPATIAPIDTATEASSASSQLDSISENNDSSSSKSSAATLAKEDAEPVRLLLENLNRLHDTLQRERTMRWNEFLRKVRAERKRDGEAAALAAAAAAEARFQRPTAVMPETRLGDGELIGVASLGVQGKVGRAKATEFRSLLLGGIPVSMRAKIWSECSGAKALRIPGYYEDLVNSSPGEDGEDDAQVVAQIKADITRTLTDNIFFRKGPGVQKLHEVLLAYSRRNPDVGYCQGMNLVVANLLLITPSAEDAFWILVAMVEGILPQGYFDHSLLASRADQQVLRQYVSEVLPKLSAHFEDLSIDLETMTFQWFLSVFTDCLSAEALFRVWDVVLCTPYESGTFLFQVALALLKLNEQQLLGCEGPAAVYTYINHQMTNHAISIDGLIHASEGLRRVVKKEEIEVRREKAMEEERRQVKEREERLRSVQEGRERRKTLGTQGQAEVQKGVANGAGEVLSGGGEMVSGCASPASGDVARGEEGGGGEIMV
ncbi:TBC1 domain family member 2A [Podospora australis]|uniref:TBC1 domain family member 2A n=1 Tax=Podospora australis TaxID=1536484 RepID=A0AAN6X0G0_9PEZI|nr:TBC1 domain family member 2A [Podospora australis]